MAGNLYDGTNARVETTEAYGDNNWHFVVFCRQGGSIYLYVDGNLKASQTGANQDVSNTATFSIGSKNPPVLGDYFEGVIDEVWICNVARSEEWIKAQYKSMNDQFTAFNKAPEKPYNPSPAHGATDVQISTTLSVNVLDPDSDVMNVYFYQTSIEEPMNLNFTIIVLPDTQYYSQSYPEIFNNQTEWIVKNKETMNIVFVTHEGDIVENWNVLAEWQNANNSMSKLDNIVPWGILPGNHDGAGMDLTNYNTYFGYERFSGESWYGGAYQDNNANSYQLFSAAGDDYLIFHFQYAPSDSVLAWANTTIDNYPDRRVIVVTHDYLGTDGSRSTNGEAIWQKFVKPHADQVFLVICGHAAAETMRTDTVDGHVVYQLLANYQSRSNGGNGWLRVLTFSPLEDKIYVKTYSPYLNSYEKDSNSDFTLDYDMTDPTPTEPKLIGVDFGIPSGEIASVPWTGLNYSTTYYWYAIATDTEGVSAQSDTWSFTTLEFNLPPTAIFTENATIVFIGDVIKFDASGSYDLDGTIVSYFWDFGDGSNETGIIAYHIYATNGTYTVTLTVTDDQGATDSANSTKFVLNRPNIAVEDVIPSKNIVGQGFIIEINVTVVNQGDFTETFNVTLYANTTEIVTKEITLKSGELATLTFTWNTTGFAKGNYTLWAYAWPVQGETDITDNTLIDGYVIIAMPGDINSDGIVDYLDVSPICRLFGKTSLDPNWNPNYDIIEDGIIDYLDINIPCRNFGKTDHGKYKN
ncbi:MAG: PKD domain-containing protein [Candidatus Bathyarchaeia archaeon]